MTSGDSLVWGNSMASTARKILLAGAALASLTFTQTAQAGGIGIHEQSASGQGMSFAGEGTSSMGLSAMFWNPAAVTQATGLWTESHVAFLFGHTVETALPGSTPLGVPTNSGNISEFAYLPASYVAYQLNPNWYVGLSVNPDFGSGTHPDTPWTGSFYTNEARIKVLDFNPVIGFKLNEQLSIAAGPRILWAFNGKFTQNAGLPPTTTNAGVRNLSDVGYGWSAGLTWKPAPMTEVALGYRSQVRLNSLDGVLQTPPGTPVLGANQFSVRGAATLPDQVSLGLKQRLDSRWTVLGTVEWTNWSVLKSAPFVITSGPFSGVTPATINFLYKDGWFFSAGLEYEWDPRTTLRGGIAYEISPSTDQFRLLGVPDDNRWWFSVGATYKWNERLTTDIGYSFVWLGDSPISYIPGVNPNATGPVTVLANSHSYNNIVAVSLRYKFDPEPRAPLITK